MVVDHLVSYFPYHPVWYPGVNRNMGNDQFRLHFADMYTGMAERQCLLMPVNHEVFGYMTPDKAVTKYPWPENRRRNAGHVDDIALYVLYNLVRTCLN